VSVEINNESGMAADEDALRELAQYVIGQMETHPLADLSMLLVDEAHMTNLHEKWMEEPGPTDVLSFPSMASPSKSRQQASLAGDVAISADIARQNSHQLGHAAVEEIKILALHGILHLAGFDHERDNGEMARKELKLRRELGLPAALIERAQSERGPSSRLLRRTTGASGARRMA